MILQRRSRAKTKKSGLFLLNVFFCKRIGFVIDVRRHCTNSASKSFITWEKGRSQHNQNCLFIRPTISLDILRGKQSNVEDYPADQVPVVPVLFTVVSWVIDHVLVVVHSCTDEKYHQHQDCSLLQR